jgi:hypothetical protein
VVKIKAGIFVNKTNKVYSKEEKKNLTAQFWDNFTLYCATIAASPEKSKRWLLRNTKVKDVHLKFEPDRESTKVILEIVHRDEDKRLEQYEKIEQYKCILEEGFPNGLVWDFAYIRDTGQHVCRIYTEKKGLDWYRQTQWKEIFEFMAVNMTLLENNFIEIRDLIR